MTKIIGIYKITSPSGKIYIGQSVNISHRFSRYRGLDCKGQPLLYRSLKRYGAKKHRLEIITQCERNQLDSLEKYYIELFQTYNNEYGLNLREGGNSTIVSEATRKKIKEATIGSNNHFFGKKHSVESRKKISDAYKNRKELGYIISPETRLKMSQSRKGKKDHLTPEKRMIVVEAARQAGLKRKQDTGHYISPENQKKMKAANPGFIRSDELRERLRVMAIGNKYALGRKLSEETKINMSIAQKKVWLEGARKDIKRKLNDVA